MNQRERQTQGTQIHQIYDQKRHSMNVMSQDQAVEELKGDVDRPNPSADSRDIPLIPVSRDNSVYR